MIAVALARHAGKRLSPPAADSLGGDLCHGHCRGESRQSGRSAGAVKAVRVQTRSAKKVDPDKVAALSSPAERAALDADDQIKKALYNGIADNDYNGVILSLVKKYCPPGLLGLALTALLASFMSGMAGNVTAFNTVLDL